MKWVSVVASIAIACAPAVGASPEARQTAQPATSTQSSSTASSSATRAPAKRKKKHYAKHEPTQKAPTADRISEIQSVLARNGYYQGSPTGKWDANTVAAMQKFQSDNGIDASGKLDAPTLQRLGLGSDIAGVSAPKPVTPPAGGSDVPAAPPSSPAASSPASTVTPAANTASSQR